MVFEIPASEPSPEELASECSQAAENAVEWIHSMSGIELDFTPPSLMALDIMLPQIINTLEDEDTEPTTILLGSYLGETILKAAGGRWETGDVFAGPGLRGLGGRELTVSPFACIRQAIKKTEPNHLAVYWNSVVERIRASEPLDDPVGFAVPPDDPLKLLPVGPETSGSVTFPSDEELAESIPVETEQFIELLKKDIGVELDYSLDSLRFLDHYFRSLSDKVKSRSQFGENRLLVYLAGHYLGEVLRRAYGGSWTFVVERETAALRLDMNDPDAVIFPHNQAAKLAIEYKPGAVMSFAEKVKRKISRK